MKAVILAALVGWWLVSAGGCRPGPPDPGASPAVSPGPADRPRLVHARVLEVVDAATIDIEANGKVHRVQYMGIEVPEGSPADDNARTLSQKALEFNRFLVAGKNVELEADAVEAGPTGMLLRYVYVSGGMVNKTMLVNGYAVVSQFPPAFRHQDEFLLAEQNARANLRGLWKSRSGAGPQVRASSPPAPTSVPKFLGGTLPAPPPGSGATAACDYSSTGLPVIKGNVDRQTGELVYHVPGGLFYSTTVIDEARGDTWFCTEAEAKAAGWKRSKR